MNSAQFFCFSLHNFVCVLIYDFENCCQKGAYHRALIAFTPKLIKNTEFFQWLFAKEIKKELTLFSFLKNVFNFIVAYSWCLTCFLVGKLQQSCEGMLMASKWSQFADLPAMSLYTLGILTYFWLLKYSEYCYLWLLIDNHVIPRHNCIICQSLISWCLFRLTWLLVRVSGSSTYMDKIRWEYEYPHWATSLNP